MKTKKDRSTFERSSLLARKGSSKSFRIKSHKKDPKHQLPAESSHAGCRDLGSGVECEPRVDSGSFRSGQLKVALIVAFLYFNFQHRLFVVLGWDRFGELVPHSAVWNSVHHENFLSRGL